jgi:CheY-like chemotaxis protein/anti-sigma regulatory factor (Ser/Thr protein kinase)
MPRKALIVEDDASLAEALGVFLGRWEFAPTLMTRGAAAVAWVRQHKPDLVLLDLMLPDVDGYDICQELKLDRATNLIPIIMVTALCEPEDRERGLRVGADYYLCKPHTEEQLREAVAAVLAARDLLLARGTQGVIHFQLPSATAHLEELNQLLASLFLFTPLSAVQVRQLMTAVRELGTNAIEWGHHNQVDRPVTVTYDIDSAKVSIIIRDTGPGFDPAHLPHAARPEDPLAHLAVREAQGLREGGFGIMLARGLVDRLEYNASGNEVRLVKFFCRPALSDAGSEGCASP